MMSNVPEFMFVLSAPLPALLEPSLPPLLLALPALPVPEAIVTVEYGPVCVACTDAADLHQHLNTHDTALLLTKRQRVARIIVRLEVRVRERLVQALDDRGHVVLRRVRECRREDVARRDVDGLFEEIMLEHDEARVNLS